MKTRNFQKLLTEIQRMHYLVIKMGKTKMTKNLTNVIKNVTTVINPDNLLKTVIKRATYRKSCLK